MKHFITIGRPNRDGTGPAKLLAGPDTPFNEQRLAIITIKNTHRYPDGIEFAEMCELVPIHRAICVAQPEQSEPKKTTKKNEKAS